jgi:hypothetical protein
MFIIVMKGNTRLRVNMTTVRKYWDNEIKFANDHIIKVQETAKEIDLMIWAVNILRKPTDLAMAKELLNKKSEENKEEFI